MCVKFFQLKFLNQFWQDYTDCVRYHNNTEITEKRTEFERVEEGDNYKLIVRDVTTELSGNYKCKVSNDLGSSETSASFTVLCKPKFKKGSEDLQIDEGDTLHLSIECFGVPEPEIKCCAFLHVLFLLVPKEKSLFDPCFNFNYY